YPSQEYLLRGFSSVVVLLPSLLPSRSSGLGGCRKTVPLHQTVGADPLDSTGSIHPVPFPHVLHLGVVGTGSSATDGACLRHWELLHHRRPLRSSGLVVQRGLVALVEPSPNVSLSQPLQPACRSVVSTSAFFSLSWFRYHSTIVAYTLLSGSINPRQVPLRCSPNDQFPSARVAGFTLSRSRSRSRYPAALS